LDTLSPDEQERFLQLEAKREERAAKRKEREEQQRTEHEEQEEREEEKSPLRQWQLDEPEPTLMRASDVRNKWSEILIDVERGDLRIIMERHGRETVALISAEDLKRYRRLMALLSPERQEQFLQFEAEREEHRRTLEEQRKNRSQVSELTNILSSEIEQVEQSLERMRRELNRLKEYSRGTPEQPGAGQIHDNENDADSR